MRGRPRTELVLNRSERQQLQAWASGRKISKSLALRSRSVLACASGATNNSVAHSMPVTPQTVSKWRARFVAMRLDGLLDAPRSGKPRKIKDAQIEAVITRTLESTPKDATHWSTRMMAREMGMSQSAISRIWRASPMTERRAFPVTAQPSAGSERRGAPRVLLPIAASSLDRTSEVPLFRQLLIAIREAILEGSLRPGTRLPSTRTIAVDLGVARNTVLVAFEQLTAEGYLESRVGAGTRIASIEVRERRRRAPAGSRSETALSSRGRRLSTRSPSAVVSTPGAFQPGQSDLAHFPHALWGRLLARHARNPRQEILTYNDTGGLAALQGAIADYLGAARGVRCESDQVVVFGGAQAALDLVARMVTDPGDPVWIEDPAYGGARVALTGARAELVPVPVDEEGFDAPAAFDQNQSARAAYVTPSSQFPLGHTMSLARRLRLLEWADQQQAWIIEDDYNSEYRYRGLPMTALQGLDEHERVIYLGTFSKTLLPGLRLAYAVVPAALVPAFRKALRNTGQDAPLLLQAALADFLAEGHFASHVRRMRPIHAERQDTLVGRLRDRLWDRLTCAPLDASMQFPAFLAPDADDRAVARSLAEAGVVVSPLSTYYLGECPHPGLLLGYAGIDEAAARAGGDVLERVLKTGPRD